MPQHEAAQRAQLGDQVGGGDDVADAQPRRERLRHRADIDDAAGAVELFSACCGASSISWLS
jgi:hypothetical protein